MFAPTLAGAHAFPIAQSLGTGGSACFRAVTGGGDTSARGPGQASLQGCFAGGGDVWDGEWETWELRVTRVGRVVDRAQRCRLECTCSPYRTTHSTMGLMDLVEINRSHFSICMVTGIMRTHVSNNSIYRSYCRNLHNYLSVEFCEGDTYVSCFQVCFVHLPQLVWENFFFWKETATLRTPLRRCAYTLFRAGVFT